MATVTLDRPDRYNALGVQIVEELREALRKIEGSGELRAMILTGAGEKTFCSGADLEERAGMDADEGWAHNRSKVALARLQVPTIAVPNGLAFGGGLEISLSCDFRIAVRGARFALPEVGLGIIPGAGGTQRLPCLVGPTRAKELILTGRRIDAGRALEIELVSEVVPADSLMQTARTLAGEIAANSPLALAYAKAAVDISSETTIEQGLRYETAAIRATLASEDYRIGLAAFAEKNPPSSPRSPPASSPDAVRHAREPDEQKRAQPPPPQACHRNRRKRPSVPDLRPMGIPVRKPKRARSKDMRIKTTLTTGLTRSGNLKFTTRTKVPMLPVMRASTTLATSPPKRKRRKKR